MEDSFIAPTYNLACCTLQEQKWLQQWKPCTTYKNCPSDESQGDMARWVVASWSKEGFKEEIALRCSRPRIMLEAALGTVLVLVGSAHQCVKLLE